MTHAALNSGVQEYHRGQQVYRSYNGSGTVMKKGDLFI